MKKTTSVILPISVPPALAQQVKEKAAKKHGERAVSKYTRTLYVQDLKKK